MTSVENFKTNSIIFFCSVFIYFISCISRGFPTIRFSISTTLIFLLYDFIKNSPGIVWFYEFSNFSFYFLIQAQQIKITRMELFTMMQWQNLPNIKITY